MFGQFLPRICLAIYMAFGSAAAAQDLRELAPILDKSVGKVLTFDASRRLQGSGSGYAVAPGRSDNEILFLTNDHVIEDAVSIEVSYGEDNAVKSFRAQVLKTSEEYDLALLRLTPRSVHGFVPSILPLADFSIEQGDEVFAIGFPGFSDRILDSFDDPAFFEPVLTSGIIGKRFENSWLRGGLRIEMLQHNAEINPGNSGGPLVNRCGAVLGINTAGPRDDGIAGASLSSSAKTVSEFLAGTAADPPRATNACVAGGRASGMSTDRVLALVATALLLCAMAGTIVYFNKYLNGHSKGTAIAKSNRQSAPVVESDAILFASFDGVSHPLTTDQLQRGLTIGRGGDADITVRDSNLSRSHAKLILQNRKLQIQDVGSTNGTKIDGVRLAARQPKQINTKSQILLGDVKMVLSKDGP